MTPCNGPSKIVQKISSQKTQPTTKYTLYNNFLIGKNNNKILDKTSNNSKDKVKTRPS